MNVSKSSAKDESSETCSFEEQFAEKEPIAYLKIPSEKIPDLCFDFARNHSLKIDVLEFVSYLRDSETKTWSNSLMSDLNDLKEEGLIGYGFKPSHEDGENNKLIFFSKTHNIIPSILITLLPLYFEQHIFGKEASTVKKTLIPLRYVFPYFEKIKKKMIEYHFTCAYMHAGSVSDEHMRWFIFHKDKRITEWFWEILGCFELKIMDAITMIHESG